MEEQPQETFEEPPSYWNSVGIAGVIFGILLFVINTIVGYATINSEPTGSMLSPMQIIGSCACVIGAFGGMMAVWYYARSFDITISLGKGALIGFLTGCAVTLVTIVLNELWAVVDPDMTKQIMESTIARIEASELPDQQKQMMIDWAASSEQGSSIFTQLWQGVLANGILNVITAMIGVKLFADEQNEFE